MPRTWFKTASMESNVTDGKARATAVVWATESGRFRLVSKVDSNRSKVPGEKIIKKFGNMESHCTERIPTTVAVTGSGPTKNASWSPRRIFNSRANSASTVTSPDSSSPVNHRPSTIRLSRPCSEASVKLSSRRTEPGISSSIGCAAKTVPLMVSRRPLTIGYNGADSAPSSANSAANPGASALVIFRAKVLGASLGN